MLRVHPPNFVSGSFNIWRYVSKMSQFTHLRILSSEGFVGRKKFVRWVLKYPVTLTLRKNTKHLSYSTRINIECTIESLFAAQSNHSVIGRYNKYHAFRSSTVYMSVRLTKKKQRGTRKELSKLWKTLCNTFLNSKSLSFREKLEILNYMWIVTFLKRKVALETRS